LAIGNPWEFPRPELTYTIRFGGRVARSGEAVEWQGDDDVLAMAYDLLVPGQGAKSVITLRLWSAKATKSIDLGQFNRGNYAQAVEAMNLSENVSRVLYPDDSTSLGRELRLRQQYFLVSASLQDILRRYSQHHENFELLPDKVAIHINDTHPAIAVPEFMRLLVDVHNLDWDHAWSLCTRVFSYTNHTLMTEALETWPVELLASILPRHLEIVLDINARFLEQIRSTVDGDPDLLRRLSLIEENGERRVRMANLAIVASHRVNGVSQLHGELMRKTVFADFARIFPDRFIAITNGVAPRRWLNQANPGLTKLIDQRIGPDWRDDLQRISALRPLADNVAFRDQFRAIKAENKRALASLIQRETGVAIDPTSLFDMQVKRIHEYKRQLLNLLHVVTRYNRILADPGADWTPRTVLIAGKAASAYHLAKLIIKLISDIGRRVNNDPRMHGLLKVAFVPNYGVSLAEAMIPAADLSEQISTAGTEASGTGNMKLALNGALTIGTEDGANIEICDQVGHDNMFIFGHSADQVRNLRSQGYDPVSYYHNDPELRQALDQIASGFFSPEEPERFRPIIDSLLRHGDRYLVLSDYRDYITTQERVDSLFRQPDEWARKAVLNVAGMGPFSSDNAVRHYADEVWHALPAEI
jgi:starch phosphorylase